jgi:ATP-dependent 26S proteasome regulatory subunit
MLALRARRMVVSTKDFEKALKNVIIRRQKGAHEEAMFV